MKHKVSVSSGEGDREMSHVESCSVGSEYTDLMYLGASRISLLGVIPRNRVKDIIRSYSIVLNKYFTNKDSHL